jgi:SAM-dependent methyltransferase
MDDQSRIIALEASGPLLDVARSKAGELSGRRIFFRTEQFSGKLSFADDVYDVTFTNLGLEEMEGDPQDILGEFVRVTKPGGLVAVTMPLRGTWTEFLDIYKEVLTKHDKHDILENLDDYIEAMPEVKDVETMMEEAGLEDVNVEVEEFTLLFKSAREFFFAPVIEYGPLRRWKGLAGKGQQMQDIFWYIKEAIDAYFTGSAFSLTVKAGCASGNKPEDEEVEADAVLDESDLEELTDDDVEEEQLTDPRESPFQSERRASSDGILEVPTVEDTLDDHKEDDMDEDMDTLTSEPDIDEEAPTRPPHRSPLRKYPPDES